MTDSTEPRAEGLKPCPNPECPTSSAPHIAEYRGVGDTAGVMYAGRCLSCFMCGPKVSSIAYARKTWNALPRPTTDTVERAAVLAIVRHDALDMPPEVYRKIRDTIRALPSAAGGEDKLREALERIAAGEGLPQLIAKCALLPPRAAIKEPTK